MGMRAQNHGKEVAGRTLHESRPVHPTAVTAPRGHVTEPIPCKQLLQDSSLMGLCRHRAREPGGLSQGGAAAWRGAQGF